MPAATRLRARRAALAAIVGVLVLVIVLPIPVAGAQTWSKNLYASRGFLYQDPYGHSCVGAATMMMLNFINEKDTGGNGFRWGTSVVKNSSDPAFKRDLTSVQWWARTYDTLGSSGNGSDAHGWRNALNYYGWGSFKDREAWVYDDRQFTSFGASVEAAVKAIARFDKPVGIIGNGGTHAQVMTGYVVTGEDPATSDDFSVTHVYVSDPLKSRNARNIRLSLSSFKSGSLRFRFRANHEADSPKDDPYTSGWRYSSVLRSKGVSEWYIRYVLILPIRGGLPGGEPEPTPPADPSPSASG